MTTNEKLARLLGFTVYRQPRIIAEDDSGYALTGPANLPGMTYPDSIMRCMACYGSEREAWRHVPNFTGDAGACLWVWDRVVRDRRFEDVRAGREMMDYHVSRALGTFTVRIVTWDGRCVGHGSGNTELKARTNCCVAALERLQKGDEG